MPEIKLDVHPSGVAIEIPEQVVVRELEWDRTAGTRCVVRFDTRVFPEPEDRILPPQTWSVIDQNFQGEDSVVGRFASLPEAEAVVVGLEHLNPADVHAGRFSIDGPAE